MSALLQVRDLRVRFGDFVAVDGVDLDVAAGELLGIVGESGSGKSVSMMAAMGLVDAPGVVSAETLRFDGHDLLRLKPAQRRRLVGKDIAMVFQDAQSSLNPSHTVGDQVREVLQVHLGLRGAALEARVLQLFDAVEIPAAKSRLSSYPHQMSGGMNQRVMIAMAMACQPRLLIADEPTTALDVTIQAQVMALLSRLQREQGLALLLVTHDLAVVAQMARRVAVMYAGQVVETGPVDAVFSRPRHPYTEALLAALPESGPEGDRQRGTQHDMAHDASEDAPSDTPHDALSGAPGSGSGSGSGSRGRRLPALAGVVPGRHDRPAGCLLSPRCRYVQPRCRAERPALIDGVRCFFPLGPPAAAEPR